MTLERIIKEREYRKKIGQMKISSVKFAQHVSGKQWSDVEKHTVGPGIRIALLPTDEMLIVANYRDLPGVREVEYFYSVDKDSETAQIKDISRAVYELIVMSFSPVLPDASAKYFAAFGAVGFAAVLGSINLGMVPLAGAVGGSVAYEIFLSVNGKVAQEWEVRQNRARELIESVDITLASSYPDLLNDMQKIK